MRSLFIAFPVFVACSDEMSFEMYEGTPTSRRDYAIWIEPSVFLSMDGMLDACAFWAPEGVVCASAETEATADVRVRADSRSCEVAGDGTYPLAYTQGDTIGVILACFRREGGGTIDPTTFMVAMAHELGHSLGIRYHIDPAEGGALMNPMLHKRLRGITVLDHEAYLSIGTSKRSNGCVLRTTE